MKALVRKSPWGYICGDVVLRQGAFTGWVVSRCQPSRDHAYGSVRLGDGLTIEEALLTAFPVIDKRIRRSPGARREAWEERRRELESIAEHLREEGAL